MELKDILLDREGGAMSLLKRAVAWLAEHPEWLAPPQREDTLEILRSARPVMSAFARLADYLSERRDPDLRALSAELAESDGRIARRFHEHIRHGAPPRIVTLSWSATVLAALRECARDIESVAVLESHPGGEGIAFAEEVRRFHPDVNVYPDNEMEAAVRISTLGVIGADSVYPDGSIVNKVHSARLAGLLARERKPLYVLTSRWKRTDAPPTDSITEPALFERVPSSRVSAVIEEN